MEPSDIFKGGCVVSSTVNRFGDSGGQMGQIAARRRSCFERIEARLLFTTIYVDINALGESHDGASWDSAFVNIPAALSAAGSGDDVRVADGTYFPTSGVDRSLSMQLKDGVTVRGGYLGGGAATPDARTGVTILSGDIGVAGDASDNSYHVLVASGTSTATLLDGFTIKNGNANGSSATAGGGGIYNSAGSLTISNCIFTSNIAGLTGGGAIFNTGASPTITGCSFTSNLVSGQGRGGAVYSTASSAPYISNCTFTENSTGQSSNGGAIASLSSAGTITDCTFNRNSSTSNGGAVYSQSSASLTIDRCNFVGNTAHAAGAFYGQGKILNSLFVANSAQYGGAAQNGSATTFLNCTFSGNSATSAGGAVWTNTVPSTFTNCVLWGNIAPLGPDIFVSSSSNQPAITFSDVRGGFVGTGNINADPRFLHSADAGPDEVWGTADDLTDLRIAGYSPLADAGNNNALSGGITTDFAGTTRRIDVVTQADVGAGAAPIVDIGAYEAASTLAASTGGPYVVLSNQSLNLGGYGCSGVAGALQYQWEWTGNGLFDDATGRNPVFPVAAFAPGSIVSLSLRVTDAASQSIVSTSKVTILSPVIYVDPRATGNGGGSSWADAFTDLQTALGVAMAGNTVRIAGGTYTPTLSGSRAATFQLKNGVSIYGGYRGVTSPAPNIRDAVTMLSGEIGDLSLISDNSTNVVTAVGTDSTPVFDGITVTSGGNGILISAASPTISNCIFRSNEFYGAYLNAGSSPPVFVNSSFEENGAGGINFASSANITGCTFRNNHGTALRTYGGTVTDCTFTGNATQGDGGAVNPAGGTIFTDCTFRGNSAAGYGGAVFAQSYNARFVGCYFYANTASVGGAVGMKGVSTQTSTNYLDFVNSVFVGNIATRGGAAGSISTTLTNPTTLGTINLFGCTLTGNQGIVAGGGVYLSNGAVYAKNSIIRGNESPPGYPAAPDITMEGTFNGASFFKCDSTNLTANGCIDLDPQFLRIPSKGNDGVWGTSDDDYGDLRLRITSPCIDRADNASVPAGITTDIAGNARIIDVPGVQDPNAITDMGAYEYVATPLLINTLTFDPNSAKPSVKATFSGDIDPTTIGSADLVLFNASTNQYVNCAQLAVTSYDVTTRTAMWSFPALLVDGNYHATIPVGAIGSAIPGVNSSNQIDHDFFALGGDANHDRTVDINDLAALAMNWQGSGKPFSKGDFNYDGLVNADDLAILSSHWQYTLPAAPPPAPVVTSTRVPARRTPIRTVVL